MAISADEFSGLAEYIRLHYGIHLKQEKRSMLMSRLEPLLHEYGLSNYQELLRLVTSHRDGDAALKLVDRITTNHTFFMRESAHFHYLLDKVLPELAPRIVDRDLRSWSAGCSFGQEPYTLAMVMDQYLGAEKSRWDSRVLATDLSTAALEAALQGEYTQDAIQPLPAGWRSAYFRRLPSGNFQAADFLKREVIFRRFNLMQETFPFKARFHFIFCRNVMIYFDEATKLRLLRRFYDSLEPGGYLFIGHSETIDRRLSGFRYMIPSVYRKEGTLLG